VVHTAARPGRIAGTTIHRMEATRATMEAGAATTGAAPVQDSFPATDSRAAVAAAGRGRSTAAAVSMAGRTTAAAGTADSPNSQGLFCGPQIFNAKGSFFFARLRNSEYTINFYLLILIFH
jgi:hypothetical protein